MPSLKTFINHDKWYYTHKHWFPKSWKKKEYAYTRDEYTRELFDRIDDILMRGYGIHSANKRNLFPFILACLDGKITPSQAAYNYAAMKESS